MNKKGSLAVDFLFTFVATIMMTFFLIMLTFSLCMSQVAQYITYAAAREYFISHSSLSAQQEASQGKFNQLKRLFFPPRSRSWFQLEQKESYHLINDNESNPYRDLFVGVQSRFKSHIVKLNPVIFGQGISQFELEISSYLGREVTTNECKNFFINHHRVKVQQMFNAIPIQLPATCPSGVSCHEC